MRSYMFLGLCALSLACGEAEDDTGTGDDTAADDTATDDTGVDTSDTGDSEEPVTPHDCLDNHGIHGSGSTWTYAWKNSSRTGARSVSVVAYDNARNTATLKWTESWVDAAATYSATRTVDFECDAGFLYMLSRQVDSTLDVSIGTPTTTSDTYTYDEPVKVQANHTADAPTPTLWTKVTKGTKTDKDDNDTVFDSSNMCWLVQADVVGYTPWLPDRFQCGTPPTGPGVDPVIDEEYYWQEDIGVVNDWDSRLTSHSE